MTNANKFQRQVDALLFMLMLLQDLQMVVVWICAEIELAHKIHARGPVGLEQLVSSKYLIMGKGQIRK